MDIIKSSDIKQCLGQCLYAFNKAGEVMAMIKRSIKYKKTRQGKSIRL